ncbi:MAG: hypothetical protein CVU23_08470 [Betaproteobacteria bacterium HGW-Betaproteobacteria-17]|nr:MAG: hypothetical protein CVU23_08470 [Betaproteobacteria bacterium HGW-Betaproteobacteria-17]
MATTGTLSEYAAHIGKSPAYVTKLKKAGRLVVVKDANGKERVNFELSDRLVMNTTDMGRANNGANAVGAKPVHVETPSSAPDPARGRVDTIFRQAQAQERAFGAKKAELEYMRAIRRVVDREATERGIFDAFRTQRDAVFDVCPKAAALCIGLGDAREIERIFTDELRKAFATAEERMKHLLPKPDGGSTP